MQCLLYDFKDGYTMNHTFTCAMHVSHLRLTRVHDSTIWEALHTREQLHTSPHVMLLHPAGVSIPTCGYL